MNAVTFGIYFNEQQTGRYHCPAIRAGAAGSNRRNIIYHRTSTHQQVASLDASAWKDYAAFTLLPEDRYIVYARLTDNAETLPYLGTDGMVFDTTAPVVGAQDSVSVIPEWAHIGAETVQVEATGVEDVMKTGLVSGKTDIMSDIAQLYLMKTMDSTANEDIVAGLTKSPEGDIPENTVRRRI